MKGETVNGFKELEIYRKSYAAAKAVYAMTEGFVKKEDYGVTGQMRRASLSIPLNIAEGCGKKRKSSRIQKINTKS